MKNASKSCTVSTAVLCTTIILVFLVSHRGEPMVVKTNLEHIPMQIGAYHGTEDFFEDSVYKELNADKNIYRHYLSTDGTQIDLYIGYYGTAKGGRTGHNPYACFPSAGWGIIEHGTAEIAYGRGKAEVNTLVVQKGSTYESVFHWYQSDKDKVLSNGIQQNIQRFIDRVLYNRNDGAFVRISMQTNKDKIQDAQRKEAKFTAKIINILGDYWPEEI